MPVKTDSPSPKMFDYCVQLLRWQVLFTYPLFVSMLGLVLFALHLSLGGIFAEWKNKINKQDYFISLNK